MKTGLNRSNSLSIFLRIACTLKSAAVIGGLTLGGQAMAQVQNDTIWGNGFFHLTDDNGTPIANDTIFCKPLQMQGDTIPDTTYTFITNSGGFTDFELPIYIDLGTGISENQTIDATVAPNPGSDFNFAYHGKSTSKLRIYNNTGQLIKEVETTYDASRDISTTYVDLSKEAYGTYIFGATTAEGKVAGKIIKANASKVGKRDVDAPQESYKNSKWMFSALYNIKASHPGYFDLEEEITFTDGQNGLITLTMEELPGIPQYQHIGGTVVDEDGNPIENATVWIKEQGTNNLLGETLTNADGSYLLPDSILPGTEFFFGVGNIEGMYSFEGDEASVPNEITQLADTLKNVFHYKLYSDAEGIPAYKIRDMTGHSNIEAALRPVKVYIHEGAGGFNQTQIDAIWDNLLNLASILGNDTLFELVDEPLNQNIVGYDPYTNPLPVGINIYSGTNNTNTDQVEVTTPLGKNYLVTFSSEMTYAGGQLELYHEMGRALGLQETGWYGIMQAGSPAFTDDDKFIWRLDLDHFKDVYTGQVYFGLDNIVDELSSSSKSSSNKNAQKPYIIEPVKEKPLVAAAYNTIFLN